jgi:23S rRNA (pseudouridine1915-N3)-methyltransferase
MKINIVAVGKIKEKFFVDAIAEYAKRLGKFCDFSVIEVPEKSNEPVIEKKIAQESELLLASCKGKIVLLDRVSKEITSPDLADIIKNESMHASTISFVIGGSNGVSTALKSKADYAISFGRITYPHQLFRVILAEQIYRAFTISAGLPYHK